MKTSDRETILNGWNIFSRSYIRLTAVIIFAAGLAALFTGLDSEPLLRQQDMLTGLSTRAILLLAGIVYLAFSVYLLVARSEMAKGFLILWLCFNWILYLVGLVWMGATLPCPAVILTGWKLGIWPRILDRYVIALIIYLAAGGILIIAMEWKAGKIQVHKASTMSDSSPKKA